MPKAKEEALGHIHMNAPRYKYFAELDMELRFGRGIAPVSGSNCGNWPPCHAAMRRLRSETVALDSPELTGIHTQPIGPGTQTRVPNLPALPAGSPANKVTQSSYQALCSEIWAVAWPGAAPKRPSPQDTANLDTAKTRHAQIIQQARATLVPSTGEFATRRRSPAASACADASSPAPKRYDAYYTFRPESLSPQLQGGPPPTGKQRSNVDPLYRSLRL